MSNIVRIEVQLVGREFSSVMEIRSISKMCMVELGYKPVCALGVCYAGGDKKYYVDLEVNDYETRQLQTGLYNNKYSIQRINSVNQNLMHNSNHSMFEYYYAVEGESECVSPYYGQSEGVHKLYRDEYSENVSYETLLL